MINHPSIVSSPANQSTKPTIIDARMSMAASTSTSNAAGTGSGNPFDDPTVAANIAQNQQLAQNQQQNASLSSPRSVTTTTGGTTIPHSHPQPHPQSTSIPPPPAAPVVAAQNPFDDPEILRSAAVAAAASLSPSVQPRVPVQVPVSPVSPASPGGGSGMMRPPLSGSIPAGGTAGSFASGITGGSIGGASGIGGVSRPVAGGAGHRPSRTLCPSELSSVAARAAAATSATCTAYHPAGAAGMMVGIGSNASTTPTSHQSLQSTPPSSSPTVASPTVPNKQTIAALSSLAAALSTARPRANTAEEAEEEAAQLARVTLGEYAVDSTGDRRSHGVSISSSSNKKKGMHRRIGSGGGGGGGGRPRLGSGGGAGMAGMDSNVALSPGSSLAKKGHVGHRRSGSMDKFKSLLLTSSPSGKKSSISSPLTLSPMRHRKAASLTNTADMMSLVDSINEAGGGSRTNSIGHGSGKGAKIFGMAGRMSPRAGGAGGRGSIGGSSKGSAGSGGGGAGAGAGATDNKAAELPPAPPVFADSDGEGDGSGHGGSRGGGMRDRYQAHRREVTAGKTGAGGGNPFVSESSLLGTDFIPSVPDLDGLVDLDGDDEDDDGASIDTPSEGGSVVMDEDDARREEEKKDEAVAGTGEDEDDIPAPDSKRGSLTHLPPPSAVSSEILPSMRSSEQDPTSFQVEIPPVEDFVLHSKLCSVVDEYREVDQNFDFASLVGMSREEMEQFVERTYDGETTLQESHRPIVSSILECGDDVVVEGFVHEVGSCSHGDAQDDTGTARDKAPDDRVEAAIFYSAHHRQFIVVWRGPNDDQAKPVRNRHLKAAKDMLAHDPHASNLSAEQAVSVFPAYRDSYFKPGIEEGVFSLLDELTDRTPFCDVVMSGHSFGSALATLAGARYASSRSQIRVCCSLYGSPKVGGVEFRHWANSLPNLKVMRVEYGSDPFVAAPEGAMWSHVGHSIVIDSNVTSVSEKDFKMENLHPKLGDHEKKGVEEKKVPVIARAYRFDQHHPTDSAGKQFLSSVAKSMTGGHHIATKSEKNDHELSVYVYAVERIANLKLPWISDFVGENAGEGVVGQGGHDRRMFV